jgi:hypothetical protein
MEPCIRRIGWFGPSTAHYFEPRYECQCVDSLKAKVYVRDVCRYCGATVERTPSK